MILEMNGLKRLSGLKWWFRFSRLEDFCCCEIDQFQTKVLLPVFYYAALFHFELKYHQALNKGKQWSDMDNDLAEAALHTCFFKEVFWKYTANIQDNTHAEVWFQ